MRRLVSSCAEILAPCAVTCKGIGLMHFASLLWANDADAVRNVQDAEQLIEALRAHVEREFARLGSSNSAGVRVKSVGDWWEADPDSKLFKMAERALTREWGRQPLFVREGGTMPVRPLPHSCRFSIPDPRLRCSSWDISWKVLFAPLCVASCPCSPSLTNAPLFDPRDLMLNCFALPWISLPRTFVSVSVRKGDTMSLAPPSSRLFF